MAGIFGYRSREIAVDTAGVLAVAGVLAAIHYGLSPSARAELVFDHAALRPVTFLTGAYVHADASHLFENLAGYLIGSGVAYVLALQAGRRRWFRTVALAAVLVLPIAVNAGSALVFRVQYGVTAITSRGFSGTVAGFGGILLIAELTLLRTVYSRRTVVYTGLLLTLLLLGELLWILDPSPAPSIIGLLLLGVGLAAAGLADRALRADRPFGREAWLRFVTEALVVLGVVFVLSWFVVGLFPAQPFTDERTTNVIGHAIGFVSGAVLALGLLPVVPPDGTDTGGNGDPSPGVSDR